MNKMEIKETLRREQNILDRIDNVRRLIEMETTGRRGGSMDDLISRQEAIGRINKIFPADPMRDDYTQGITCGAALANTYVAQLPSAQPEITLESAIDYLHSIGWMQEHDRILTESAQPEQRKGEWIDEGFYADGHGAHAFRCSECGGHIIEYDADPFCRWCGADMRGEQDG